MGKMWDKFTGKDKLTVNINEPCANCGKVKRTLCIRSSKPAPANLKDFGHSNLALIEAKPDGSNPTLTTYGNWPSEGSSGASTVKTNYGADRYDHRRYQYVRCKEINEKQYEQLQNATKGQQYDYFDKNCAKWAGTTWNNVTGENLDYGVNNAIYHAPSSLSNSIYSANGGLSQNYNGSFYKF
jgi:hypothetical protein